MRTFVADVVVVAVAIAIGYCYGPEHSQRMHSASEILLIFEFYWSEFCGLFPKDSICLQMLFCYD